MSGGDKSHAKFAKSAKEVGRGVLDAPQRDDISRRDAEAQSYWFGDVPEGWVVKRLASYFSERKVKVSDKDFPPLSVTKNGILPQ